jgi:tetratricopeptide (TPR) repeat protein
MGVLCAAVYFWLDRRRLGRNFFAGLWFYVITIGPLLGFISNYTFQYSFVADHYQYLSSLGILAIVVGGFTRIIRKYPAIAGAAENLVPGRLVIFAGIAVLALLWTGTWRQSKIYQNSEILWVDTLKKNPSSWLAHNNIGNIFMSQGRLKEAVKHFRAAMLHKPDLTEAYYNCGLALGKLNRLAEAIMYHHEALRIRPSYSKAAAMLVTIHNNLGIESAKAGRLDESVQHFKSAIKISPTDLNAGKNLETVLGMKR